MIIFLEPGRPTRWLPEEPCGSGMVGDRAHPRPAWKESLGALQKRLLGTPTLLYSRRIIEVAKNRKILPFLHQVFDIRHSPMKFEP